MQKEISESVLLTKISELQSALFFPETKDRILTTCIIQQVETSGAGNIAFVIPHPAHAIDINQDGFPCTMDFFKKGAGFHVKIIGVARFVEVAEENENKTIRIVVKIVEAAYFETAPAAAQPNSPVFIAGAVQDAIKTSIAQVFDRAFWPELQW